MLHRLLSWRFVMLSIPFYLNAMLNSLCPSHLQIVVVVHGWRTRSVFILPMMNMLYRNCKKKNTNNLSRLRRLSKVKAITTSTNKKKAKRCRKTATTTKKADKENETFNNRQTAASVQQLEDVIQFTPTTFDNGVSDEEF